ncbi:hypothetical protein Sa4125_30510 [Aureimonas sp. SA4125]|uniref:PilZ domain-containing protein n=1 Tax=Aureimonas sp. SA4125 TaxID=2826993 RepID=UPI001CC58B99|nr:PilZ domain-containing protein [Aureimonas sp. SA4125]BDA85509.1 hypothetical protein Sa4125_30510 [Aureimonas sp. SA4125]
MAALPETEPDGSERRVAPRVRTLKRAKILFNNRYSTFDCIVRNISSTGALLTIDEAAHLPKTFDITIGDEKTERPARLVYRRGVLAGIRFLDVVSEDEEQAAHFPLAPAVATSTVVHDTLDQGLGHVQRIVAEILPRAIVRNYPWSGLRN